jgi:replicative DNA helicase
VRDDERIDQLRIPPQSVEAEQAVLGGLMLAPDAYDIVADILTSEDFYRHDHQLIFQAVGELAEKNQPYDAVTLGEWFESKHQTELVNGGAYLIELASTTPSAANIKAYAEIVRDKALLRSLIEAGTHVVNRGFMPDGDETAAIIAEAEDKILAVGNRTIKEVESGEDGLKRMVKELARRRTAGPNALLGVTTGIDDLDEMTLGLQPGDLVILGARPSMGKTALVRSFARAASRAGIPNATFEMEMSSEQVYMRDVAAVGRIDFNHVRRPALADANEMNEIRRAISTLRSYPWWMDDTPSLTTHQIVARARRLKRQHDVKVIYIDYLQFIDISRYLAQKLNVNNALQQVTRLLKSAAKTLNIAIVLLSQLNRGVESRGDKRPNMADLRESGAIEQDADLIMFLHRPAYYERDLDHNDPKHHVAEIIVAKQRNGPTGIVTARWDGKYQRFDTLRMADLPPTFYEKKGSGFEPRRTSGLVNTGGT